MYNWMLANVGLLVDAILLDGKFGPKYEELLNLGLCQNQRSRKAAFKLLKHCLKSKNPSLAADLFPHVEDFDANSSK